jgi:hypothetical protein
MLDAFLKREPDNAKKAFDALQASETELKNRLRNEVIYNYFSYTKTRNLNSIDELIRLSKIEEIRSLALYWLSECYQFDNAFEQAKSTLRSSRKITFPIRSRLAKWLNIINFITEPQAYERHQKETTPSMPVCLM